MKLKYRLVTSVVLLFPAAYGITGWFTLDAQNKHKTLVEMGPLYKAVLPLPGFSFTQQILVLLFCSFLGCLVITKSHQTNNSVQKGVRVFLLVFGLAEVALLSFSLM